MASGDQVCLLADDPLARIDVPHFAGQTGATVLDVTEQDGATSFLIQKG